ncbi:MAG: DUF2269 family protein [Candidatus Limnocylindrales bacterium]
MSWVPWLLLLHIGGAIVAFGPTFAFPLIGAMGGREPMHANFATRVSDRISHRMTLPLAVVQGITGVLLIIATGRNLADRSNWWLGIGIFLYAMALSFSIFVQTPRVAKVIEMTSTPPPPPATGSAPTGPPPALMAAVRTVQQGGMILTVLIVSIIVLMVLKPTF